MIALENKRQLSLTLISWNQSAKLLTLYILMSCTQMIQRAGFSVHVEVWVAGEMVYRWADQPMARLPKVARRNISSTRGIYTLLPILFCQTTLQNCVLQTDCMNVFGAIPKIQTTHFPKFNALWLGANF
jgi:hypothetical protein